MIKPHKSPLLFLFSILNKTEVSRSGKETCFLKSRSRRLELNTWKAVSVPWQTASCESWSDISRLRSKGKHYGNGKTYSVYAPGIRYSGVWTWHYDNGNSDILRYTRVQSAYDIMTKVRNAPSSRVESGHNITTVGSLPRSQTSLFSWWTIAR